MDEVPDLELVRVSRRYGSFAAVREVSLAARRGEFLALLGPSGCGKTTTLRMIAGLLEPDEGRILVRGADVIGVPTHKRNVGMVFQNYALFPHRTVAENIAFGLGMRRLPRGDIHARVEKMLDLVRLAGLGGRYPRQLSGGQQQRVALARALAIQPSLLLLDEPLSNLDLKLRQEMRLELRAIQSELGITTVFVTHDQEEALIMADRIAVMRAGQVEQVGTSEEVYHDPANSFIADFLGESNLLPGEVEEIESKWIVCVRLSSGLALRGRTLRTVQCGDRVTLAVRPERMRIVTGRGTRVNQLAGTVSEVVFKGANTRYHVLLPGGVRCAVEQQNASDERIAGRGQEVIVEWRVEDCLVLPADGGGVG